MTASTTKLTPLRRAFVDICKGYSLASYNGKRIFIRHLSHEEHLDYDSLQVTYEQEARAKGAKTEAERLAKLRSEGRWSDAKEREILQTKDFIGRLEEGKRVVSKLSTMESQEKQIAEEKEKLAKMVFDRADLIGMTCEVYAQRKLNDYYIVSNLFRDPQLTEPLFSDLSFDSLTDGAVEELLKVYYASIDCCSESNLKMLAVQDFFTSCYNLCEDKAHAFYGKPVSQLTYYQIRLANIARYFRAVIQGCDLSKVDPEVRNDPDAIERLYLAQKNAADLQAQGKTPVGMTNSDARAVGMNGTFTPITQELSGQDLIRHLQRGQR